MPAGTAAARIADTLRVILARGLNLTDETLRFIDSTFSPPSAAALAVILQEDSAPESDSLLELLFSPDEPLQIELEERLGLPPGEEAPSAEEVVGRLVAAPQAVAFRFPDGRGVLEFVMTAPLARRLVSGLGIDRVLPHAVAEVIAANVPGPAGQRLRVMLRNARFGFTPSKSELLCALIPKLDVQEEDDWVCLAFALELLAEIEEPAEIYPALVARKKWLAKALHHGRRLRAHLAQSNVETLLSRGQRLAWVDEALARRQMGHIDRICGAVFGRIPSVDADGWSQTLDIEASPDAADLLRRLS
jgi:hypothetical protein